MMIVEDGSGVLGANSYVPVDWADDYFATRGEVGWTGSEEVKGQLLIRATDYFETRWGPAVAGRPQFVEPRQPLSFPRAQLYDFAGLPVEGIPANLKAACCLYALRAKSAELMPDPVTDPSGALVTNRREKIGPVEKSQSFSVLQGVTELKSYPAADRLVQEYLIGRGRGRVYR